MTENAAQLAAQRVAWDRLWTRLLAPVPTEKQLSEHAAPAKETACSSNGENRRDVNHTAF